MNVRCNVAFDWLGIFLNLENAYMITIFSSEIPYSDII